MTRTTSFASVRFAALAISMLNRQFMSLMRHFRPMRCTSVTPCAILLQLSCASVAPVAMAASSMSRSWNFSSPIDPPKNPPVLVNPRTTLGLNLGLTNPVLEPLRPDRTVLALICCECLSFRWLAMNPLIFCLIFVELSSYKYWNFLIASNGAQISARSGCNTVAAGRHLYNRF